MDDGLGADTARRMAQQCAHVSILLVMDDGLGADKFKVGP